MTEVASEKNKDHSVFIRPLQLEDAKISFEWRNDPRIWRFTGSRPDRHITYEIEAEWLENVLKRENEKRFAICDSETGKYIGNVFLTDITEKEGYLHIFIGDMAYWGKGRANQACYLICNYGFTELNLEIIYAEINQKNNASLAVGKSIGMVRVDEYFDDKTKLTLVKLMVTNQMLQQAVQVKDEHKS